MTKLDAHLPTPRAHLTTASAGVKFLSPWRFNRSTGAWTRYISGELTHSVPAVSPQPPTIHDLVSVDELTAYVRDLTAT